MSEQTVSCPVFGCTIQNAHTDLKEQAIRTIGSSGITLLSAFVCHSCHSIAGAESYPRFLGIRSSPTDKEYSNTRHCPACGAETSPEIGKVYRNRLFEPFEIQIAPVGCPECEAIVGIARYPRAAPLERSGVMHSTAGPLPYQCPGCECHDRPRHVTWPMRSEKAEVHGVGVTCQACDQLWGSTVIETDFDNEMLVGDNLHISQEVATPDTDFNQVYDEFQDFAWDLTPEQSPDYTCRHCKEVINPKSGWIPTADGQSVLSVVAEYCPKCEGVLGITWG